MSMLKKVFLRISGNRAVQGAIENKVQSLQELLGIGSGDGVLFSGEQAVFDILRQKFNPPYCIFDVGANQGQFLRLLLEHIAVDDFTVHCFEPGRETFKMLVASSKDDGRIRLNNIGLAKSREKPCCTSTAPDPAWRRLRKETWITLASISINPRR